MWRAGQSLYFNRSIRRSGLGFTYNETKVLIITCFGLSPRVIKELLAEVRAGVLRTKRSKIKVWRAQGVNSRSLGGLWTRPWR